MALLKPRKWEILVKPYIEYNLSGETVKLFPDEFTEFGVLDPRIKDQNQDNLRLLPLRSPAKSVREWIPLGEKKTDSGEIEYNYNWQSNSNKGYQIVLLKPYKEKDIRLFKTKKVGDSYIKGDIIPENKYSINKTQNQTIINYYLAETEILPNPIRIDVMPDEPILPAYISYFETYSYNEALTKYYEIIKVMGQGVVELKEVIPFDLNILPRY